MDEYTFHPNKSATSPRRGKQVQFSVNISGKKLMLATTTRDDPHKTAIKFMREYNIEKKYLQTLSDLIHEQQKQKLLDY